mmetsp:Transcript_57921/g.152532  ORF Transcript_57921/g.152532 Transcript_57921/m.152532 type:complete len:459 (-) Transcript_57921:61-1437(-)
MNAALKRQFEAAAAIDDLVEEQKKSRGREIGTVEAYDRGKGFGFIKDSDKEKVFVHQSQIISPGFRVLAENQKVSFIRGENRGKPWAEDVRNPDGSPIAGEVQEEPASVAKKRRAAIKEQWRNFFDIPQYALKSYAETLPATSANQDSFVLGDPVPQLGKAYALFHGCCNTSGKGNECTAYLKDRTAKYIGKMYEENSDTGAALAKTFETLETEWMERAKMKSLTDGAEACVCLFVHALNASGQPCVQLWVAGAGNLTVLMCSAEGKVVRALEPHSTRKAKDVLEKAAFIVDADGNAEVAFAEVGTNRPSQAFKLPASRLIGGRPFKTSGKSPVTAKPEVKRVREWRCVAGEELFLLVVSAEVLSVLSDEVVMNAALDAWASSAEDLDGWEASSKAVVRTARAAGPKSDALACMAVQCWWQEKPLQKLLARRAEEKKSGVKGAATVKPADDDLNDMFG